MIAIDPGSNGAIIIREGMKIHKMPKDLKGMIDIFTGQTGKVGQSKLKLRIKGENKTDRKKRYKDTAQRLYPDIKVTMNNCDALLILKYAEAYL